MCNRSFAVSSRFLPRSSPRRPSSRLPSRRSHSRSLIPSSGNSFFRSPAGIEGLGPVVLIIRQVTALFAAKAQPAGTRGGFVRRAARRPARVRFVKVLSAGRKTILDVSEWETRDGSFLREPSDSLSRSLRANDTRLLRGAGSRRRDAFRGRTLSPVFGLGLSIHVSGRLIDWVNAVDARLVRVTSIGLKAYVLHRGC